MSAAAGRAAELAIGVFDGVHRGHQSLIQQMVRHARDAGCETVCITFEPDPDRVLHPERAPATLSSVRERSQLLTALGVERVDTLQFTRELAHQTPSEFVGWLHRTYPFRLLWVGRDFALGRDRAGTIDTLSALGKSVGFEVIEVEPLMEGDRPISSTWIRELLKAGDLKGAARLLGRTYCLQGRVIEGARRGRQVGFPTANLLPPEGWALPPDGVYFVRVELSERSDERSGLKAHPSTPGPSTGRYREERPGVANLGSRPTFSESQRLLETHVLDYEGDLYEASIRVCFVEQIRQTQRFDSLEELRAQIQRDVEWARAKAGSSESAVQTST